MSTRTSMSPSEMMNGTSVKLNTENNTENVKSDVVKVESTSKTNATYFSINLGHKTVMARKWKAKDRKNFKKSVKVSDDIDVSIINELVINCLENPNEALSNEELQYILIEIRKHSISDTIDFEYICSNCEKDNKEIVKIDDINKPKWENWGIVNGIEFGNIANAKFYNDNKDEEDDIKEIAFHTMSINGEIDKTFDEVVEYFDDMDINEFDVILNEFNKMKFSIDNTKEFKCECGHTQIFEFDEIPGFFPDSWLK